MKHTSRCPRNWNAWLKMPTAAAERVVVDGSSQNIKYTINSSCSCEKPTFLKSRHITQTFENTRPR